MKLFRTSDELPGIALGEWEEGEIQGVALSQRDLRLVEKLRVRSRDAAVDVRPMTTGVSVRAQGAVGLVRFDQFELRIEPKLPGGHLELFRTVEFSAGITGSRSSPGAPA